MHEDLTDQNHPSALHRYPDGDALSLALSADASLTLEQVLLTWLHAKATRTESAKTERAYRDGIVKFRAVLQDAGLDLDSPNAPMIAVLAQGWSSKNSKTGKLVSASTYNQRLSILSSFYTYAIKRRVCRENPILLVDRRPESHPEAAHPLATGTVKTLLDTIDRESAEGLRDHALLSLALSTGRRASELAGLRWGHIRYSGSTMVITWPRCKGAKVMHDVIKSKTCAVLLTYLRAVYGADLMTLSASTPIWISFSNHNRGGAICTQTIARICEAHLGTSKVHTTRHTFAVGMDKSGASITTIGDRLGHSNYKTTADYMKELRDDDNPYGDTLEDLFGI